MPLFAITIELAPGSDDRALRGELDRLGALKALASCYLADLNFTAENLKQHLGDLMGDNDKLMVVEFAGRAAYFGASADTNGWLALHR